VALTVLKFRATRHLRDPQKIRQAPRWLRRLELIVTNLAATVLFAELTLRAYVAWGNSPTLLLNSTLEAHRLIPGHDYGDGLHGNRLGYPGRDFERQKRPGICRIAALGDSFAVGPAVPFAENYLTLLEQRLPHTEVYNYGVSGAGPREYLMVLQRDVWAYQPDLILLSIFVGNDITEVLPTPRWLDPRQHTLYVFLQRGWRLAREHGRKTSPSGYLSPGRVGTASLSHETFREIESRRLSVCVAPPSAALQKKWRRALASLEQIIADCRQRKVRLAVVLIPDEFQINPTVRADAIRDAKVILTSVDVGLPQRRLVAFFGKHDVSCLDLLPVFEQVPETYAPNDTHWNIRGNRLAADAISRWLSEAGLLMR
jgi:hypothetical protein